MHTIEFSSAEPQDDLCRALDAMRRMGFRLITVTADRQAAQTFRVLITFESGEELSATALVERIRSCVGFYDVSDDVTAPTPHTSRR